jgi:hypothetical protein
MYIPMLAREVVEGNIRGEQPHINIKVRGARATHAHGPRWHAVTAAAPVPALTQSALQQRSSSCYRWCTLHTVTGH